MKYEHDCQLSIHDVNPHTSCRSFEDVFRGVDGSGVEVFHLFGGNFLELLLGNLSDFGSRYVPASTDDSGSLFEQVATVRTFRFQFERSICEDLDDDGNSHPKVGLGPFVELLDELSEVDPVFTQSGSHRRRCRRLTALRMEPNRCRYLFCHDSGG